MKKIIMLAALAAVATQAFANPLYNGCKGCHGVKGERPAMGKSKIINEMTPTDIKTALAGYKDESYGGVMKNVMMPQVSRLTPDAIDALATYIPTLK